LELYHPNPRPAEVARLAFRVIPYRNIGARGAVLSSLAHRERTLSLHPSTICADIEHELSGVEGICVVRIDGYVVAEALSLGRA
jgi:hypothetical protein